MKLGYDEKYAIKSGVVAAIVLGSILGTAGFGLGSLFGIGQIIGTIGFIAGAIMALLVVSFSYSIGKAFK